MKDHNSSPAASWPRRTATPGGCLTSDLTSVRVYEEACHDICLGYWQSWNINLWISKSNGSSTQNTLWSGGMWKMRGIREEEVFMRARCARRASQVFHTNIFLFKQLFLVFWNAVPVFPCCRGSDLCIPRVSRHSGHYTGHRTPPARPARGCSHLPTLAQARNKRLSTDAQHSDLKTFWVFLYQG